MVADGQLTLRPSQANPRAAVHAECCLIVPLSADNRMINMVTGRSFAHEPIPAAIGSHGRENFPDLALLMDAMDLRYCCRLDCSAWGRSAAVSCLLPNGRGRCRPQGSKSLVRSVDRSVMPKPDPHLRGAECIRRSCGTAGAAASLIEKDARQRMAGWSRRRDPRRSPFFWTKRQSMPSVARREAA